MILIIVAVLSVIIGLVRKGSFSNIFDSGLRAWFLFVIALLLFVAIRVGDGLNISVIQNFAYILLLVAYAILLLGVILNLNNIWMFALLIGSVMNFVVTFINGGKMPISADMLSIVGIAEKTLAESSTMAVATSSTSLSFLGGIIPIPLPSVFAEVISPGTVIIAIGLFMLIQNLLLGVVYEYEEDDDDDEYDDDDYEEEKLSRKERREQKKRMREAEYDDEDEYDNEEDKKDDDEKDYTSGQIDIHNAPGAEGMSAEASESEPDLINDILYDKQDSAEQTAETVEEEKELSLQDIADSETLENYDDSIEDDFTAVFDTTELSAIHDEVNGAAPEEDDDTPLSDDFEFDKLEDEPEAFEPEETLDEEENAEAEDISDELEAEASEEAYDLSDEAEEHETNAAEFFNEFEDESLLTELPEDIPEEINEPLFEEMPVEDVIFEQPVEETPAEEIYQEQEEELASDLSVHSDALEKAIDIFDKEIPQQKEEIENALSSDKAVEEEVDTDSPFVIVNGRIVENPYYKFRKGNKENIVSEDESITPGINEVKTRSSASGRPSFTPPNMNTEPRTVTDEQPMGYEKVEMKIGDVKIKFWKKDNEDDSPSESDSDDDN